MRFYKDVGVHLQEVGKEYGTTTGRRRRCGWLDLVVLKHSCLINGYDSLNITKLDVLDELSEIKVGVQYLVDGKELPGIPGSFLYFFRFCGILSYITPLAADLEVLAKVEVEYITLPGWRSRITEITWYDALPENCKKYVQFIEEYLNIPVEWIGVGPGRESMLTKYPS